jgi:hypothetical protein
MINVEALARLLHAKMMKSEARNLRRREKNDARSLRQQEHPKPKHVGPS